MTDKFLFQQIQKKASFLCVGLDIDLEKIPHHLGKEEDPIFVFAKAIIDATNQFSVAYKLNLAFFEAYGIVNNEESVGKVYEISQDTGLTVTRKNKKIAENNRKNRRFYGGEVDGISRQLARYISKTVKTYMPEMNPKMILNCQRSNPGVFPFIFEAWPKPIEIVI